MLFAFLSINELCFFFGSEWLHGENSELSLSLLHTSYRRFETVPGSVDVDLNDPMDTSGTSGDKNAAGLLINW
jgi:hypothetical protein